VDHPVDLSVALLALPPSPLSHNSEPAENADLIGAGTENALEHGVEASRPSGDQQSTVQSGLRSMMLRAGSLIQRGPDELFLLRLAGIIDQHGAVGTLEHEQAPRSRADDAAGIDQVRDVRQRAGAA